MSFSGNILSLILGNLLDFKQQTAEEKYGAPENFLEIEVVNPKIQNELTSQKYVDYEIICRVTFQNLNFRQIFQHLNSGNLQLGADIQILNG